MLNNSLKNWTQVLLQEESKLNLASLNKQDKINNQISPVKSMIALKWMNSQILK